MKLLTAGRDLSADVLKRSLKEFRPALSRQGRRLATVLLATLGVTTLELLRPWPIKFVLDEVLINESRRRGFWNLSAETSILVAAAAILIISLLIGFLSARATVTAARVGRDATSWIRRRVFEHLHRLALPFHQTARSGDLLVRLMGDVNMLRDVLFASWVEILGRATLFTGVLVVMLMLDPALALLALAPAPLLLVGLGRASRKLRSATRKQRRREGDAAALAADTLRQIRVVKAYAAESRATDDFAAHSGRVERSGVRAAVIAARMNSLTEIMTGAGLALVLLFGGRNVLSGRITPGELVVLISYARSMYKPLRGLSKQGGRLSKATACAERVLEILDLEPESDFKGMLEPPLRGEIVFDRVGYTYPNGTRALDGLSFALRSGELAVLSGPSGSGKSTTISVLLRLLSPQRGRVLIDGHDVQKFNLDTYRRSFAYVPQDSLLFGASVKDNIAYGRPDASDADIEAAARAALIHEMIVDLPEGYATVLGEDVATLSGGEAKRLMLARAAVRRAKVLLLDEPLAGLDSDTRGQVAEAIRHIAMGRTTIAVSHGPANELGPDVVLRLEHGRLDGEWRDEIRPEVAADRIGTAREPSESAR
jgi:ATP-binding cassette subfamily B protein